jgi:hypothetical protein
MTGELLAELRAELEAVRADPRATKGARVQAFERWHNEAFAQGQFDLERRIGDEAERFWSRVAEGTDGHRYWLGSWRRGFVRNDGRNRRPQRWVWEYDHGPLPRTIDVWSVCGEPHCVAPRHLAAGRSDRRRWYPTDRILGALQVAALRLGHAPGSKWWDRSGLRPSSGTILRRFGSWEKAQRAAGLEPWLPVGHPQPQYTRDGVLEGVRALAEELGHPPSARDWNTHGDWLAERGYPRSHSTVVVRIGSGGWAARGRGWADVLEAAGLK